MEAPHLGNFASQQVRDGKEALTIITGLFTAHSAYLARQAPALALDWAARWRGAVVDSRLTDEAVPAENPQLRSRELPGAGAQLIGADGNRSCCSSAFQLRPHLQIRSAPSGTSQGYPMRSPAPKNRIWRKNNHPPLRKLFGNFIA